LGIKVVEDLRNQIKSFVRAFFMRVPEIFSFGTKNYSVNLFSIFVYLKEVDVKQKIKMKKTLFFLFFICTIQISTAGTRTNSNFIEDTEYIQIILYGQSLGMGWECPVAITTEPVNGNYMLGDNVLMKYSNQAVLTPLVATKWSSGGEQPIVSCVNSFSKMYRENVNADQKFIAMIGGEGGQTIERLSKECTNGGFYTSTFTKILNNTVTALNGTATVSCPAIIYMQGEYNCDNSSWYGGRGMTPGTDGTTDKDTYKALLVQLKNNMQADIMQKYGQTKKPLFFIYQTSGSYIRKKEVSIAMAQYEFATENDDVIMLNPHYALPDYGGGHLSTNGYRWFGELAAQTLYDVLVQEQTFMPVSPETFSVSDNVITIKYHVPSPPLVLDTWTNRKIPSFGFSVYSDDAAVSISTIEVTDNDKVVLTCASTLGQKVEVTYAGKSMGTGNLRDSRERQSMYTYFDDSADSKKENYTPQNQSGTKLYGSHYPLYNWSVGFYHEINSSASGLQFQHADNTLNIYPNPVQNTLVLETKNHGKISIYDSTGRLTLISESNIINVSTLVSGVYFVKAKNGIAKFIKE
jgi:hypothetical protein